MKKVVHKVIVADDDDNIRKLIAYNLKKAGFVVIEAKDGKDVLAKMTEDISLAFLDLQMPNMNGIECLKGIKKNFSQTECIIVSAVGKITDVVEAMDSGAFWYIEKPFEPEELINLANRALSFNTLKKENLYLKEANSQNSFPASFIGESIQIKNIEGKVDKISNIDSSVLITGPSGTGKSTLARLIHQRSERRDKPFVSVSCAAIPRDLIESELFGHTKGSFTGAHASRAGKIEVAEGGTLFLDEIGDMPIDLQPKLLTFLQDRTYQRIGSNKEIKSDVRIIAATHQNLKQLCIEKKFREDLYFRINVIELELPSLVERQEDIPILVDSILKKIAAKHGVKSYQIDKEAIEKLQKYSWPGNVRELENILERAAIFHDGNGIKKQDIYTENEIEDAKSFNFVGLTLAQIEHKAIVETLKFCEGSKAKAAKILGISQKSVYNKLAKIED